MTLGSASFEFLAENRDLIVKGAQAEAAAKKNYEAIAKAAGVSAADVERSHKRMMAAAEKAEREERRSAEVRAQSVLKLIRAHNDAGEAAEKSAAKIAGAAKKTGAPEWLKGAAAVAGFVGVVETARAVVDKVATSTLEASKAQFALSKAYGDSAPAMAAWAKQVGDEIGRSTTEVTKAATTMGVLTRSYGLSQNQAKLLVRQTADLAAANGESLAQSAKDVQSAIRGEAEAAEKLGVVLNDTRVATSQLGADGEKLWNTLTEEEKATLRLLELQKQLADRRGAAADEANTLQGAVNRLNAAMDELAVTVGETLTPYLRAVTNDFAKAAESVNTFLERLNGFGSPELVERILRVAKALAVLASVAVNPLAVFQIPDAIQDIIGGVTGAPPSSAGSSGARPESPEESAARAEGARKAAEIKAIAQERAALERRKKNADEAVKIENERIEREREANQEAYEAERDRLIAARDAKIKASQDAEKATIKSIEAEAKAAEKAFQEQLAREEQKRDAEIEAAEAAADAATEAIKAEQDRLEAVRELEDRARDDERRAEDQALADQRDREDAEVDAAKDRIDRIRDLEDRALDQEREAEDRALEDRREKEDRELDEQIARIQRRREEEDRALEDRREKEDRRLEEQAEARARQRELEDRAIDARREAEDRARESSHEARLKQLEDEHDAVIRALDAEAEAIRDRYDEQERLREAEHERIMEAFKAEQQAARDAHDAAMDALAEQGRAEDDRHRQALKAIKDEEREKLAAIDRELGLLDAADDAERNAERDRQLADAVTNAEFGLLKAQSTGNQSEIVKAEQELADARDAIRREGVKRERDAARDQLRARADAIKEESRLREEAEKERNRQREEELRKEREAAQAILSAQLAAILQRQTTYQTTYKDEREAARTLLEEQLEAVSARKEAEQTAYKERIERIKAEFEAESQRIKDQRQAEDYALEDRRQKEDDELDRRRQRIEDRRQKEDRDREDRRKAEDDELQRQRTRMQDRRSDEDRAISDRRTKEDQDRSDRRLAEDAQARESDDRRARQRLEEDRALNERRIAEDRSREDFRRAEDARLATQLAAVSATLEQERKQIDAHYNGPQGVLTQIREAMNNAKEEYRQRLDDAREKFAAEREEIKAVYSNSNKDGLLDLLEKSKEETDKSLNKQKEYWEKWREKVIDEVNKAFDHLKERQQAANLQLNPSGGFGNTPYGPGMPGNPGEPEGGWAAATRAAAVQAGFSDPDVFVKQIRQESGNFDPDVISGKRKSSAGAMGIAQFMPGTAQMLGVDPLNPMAALAAAAAYMTKMERQYAGFHGRQGIVNALWAYNAGEGNLQKGILPSETQKYLNIILGGSYGFANGHLFNEPTMTYGLRSGMRGVIGETGRPERLLGVNDTAALDAMKHMRMPSLMAGAGSAYQFSGAAMMTPAAAAAAGRSDQITVDVNLDDNTVERLVFTGISLNVRRNRLQEIRKQ